MFQMIREKKMLLQNEALPTNNIGRYVDEIVVDQFYSQDFCLGENGFPQSDVSMFLNAQSEELRMQIAARMNEVKSNYPDQNLSDEQLAALSIPRNVQSAADFKSWFSHVKDVGFEKAVNEFVEAHKPKEAENVIKFDENKTNDE